jgi:hypothetical protein
MAFPCPEDSDRNQSHETLPLQRHDFTSHLRRGHCTGASTLCFLVPTSGACCSSRCGTRSLCRQRPCNSAQRYLFCTAGPLWPFVPGTRPIGAAQGRAPPPAPRASVGPPGPVTRNPAGLSVCKATNNQVPGFPTAQGPPARKCICQGQPWPASRTARQELGCALLFLGKNSRRTLEDTRSF